MRYRTLVELRDALDAEIRLRCLVPPDNFTGLFTPDALEFWQRTGKTADEIATYATGAKRPEDQAA